MSLNIRVLAPVLAAGAAAAAVAVAPIAAAADETHLTCTYQTPGNSQCETPGNSQLTATPQDLPYMSQYPYLMGSIIVRSTPSHGFGGHR